MKEKLLEIKRTLDTSIFVGERYERNLANIAITAVIVMLGISDKPAAQIFKNRAKRCWGKDCGCLHTRVHQFLLGQDGIGQIHGQRCADSFSITIQIHQLRPSTLEIVWDSNEDTHYQQ